MKINMAIILPLCLIMLFACSVDPNVKANELYVEASIQIESAIADTNSYSNAYKSIDNAYQSIELISSQYAQSNVGMNLISGSLDVSGFTLEHLQKLHGSLKQLALAEQEVLPCALLVARSLNDVTERITSITTIGKIYADSGQDSIALRTIDFVEREYFKATIIARVAVAYADSGRFADAIALAGSIPDPVNRAELFYEISLRYAKSRLFDEALSMTEMITDGAYRALALTEIADEFSKNSQEDMAMQLLIQSRQVADTIEEEKYKAIAISQIAVKYMDRSKYIEAFEVAEELKVAEDRESTFSKIAHKYIEVGQIPEALKIADKIKGDSKNYILREVARKYAEVGQVKESTEIISPMDTISQALVYSSIADDFIKADQNEEAAGVLNKSLLLAESVDEAASADDSFLKLITLAELARQFAEIDKFQEALDISDKLENNWAKAYTLVLIADEYFKTDQKYMADQLLLQSIEIAYTIDDLAYKLWTIGNIADSYAKADFHDKAIELMVQSQDIVDSDEYVDERDSMLRVISSKLVELGDLANALQIVNEIDDLHRKTELLIEMSSISGVTLMQSDDDVRSQLQKIVQTLHPIGKFWDEIRLR